MGRHYIESHSVPAFDIVVGRNALTLLQTPGDLTLRNGDTARTRSGDLMLNDEIYSALVRIVQFWRHNFPALRQLFDIVLSSQETESDVDAEIDELGSRPWEPGHGVLGSLDVDALHALDERTDAIRESRGIYPATIMLVVGRALSTLRADLGVPMNDRRAAGPKTHGRSVGEMIEAAGNNFRHADEWLVASGADRRQMKSIEILSDILQEPLPSNGSIRAFARDISPEVIDLITRGDFMRLESAIFAFAKELAARAVARSC